MNLTSDPCRTSTSLSPAQQRGNPLHLSLERYSCLSSHNTLVLRSPIAGRTGDLFWTLLGSLKVSIDVHLETCVSHILCEPCYYHSRDFHGLVYHWASAWLLHDEIHCSLREFGIQRQISGTVRDHFLFPSAAGSNDTSFTEHMLDCWFLWATRKVRAIDLRRGQRVSMSPNTYLRYQWGPLRETALQLYLGSSASFPFSWRGPCASYMIFKYSVCIEVHPGLL